MNRHGFWLAGLLTVAGLSAPARATTVLPLTLAQQAKKADVIVQATIGTPTTATEAGRTYAVYPLKVSETLAGDAAQLPQTAGSQGGSGPALYILTGVDVAPVFQAGQEAVLLLYKGRLDSPLVGYNQGAYLIANGQVSVLPIPTVNGAGAGTIGQSNVPVQPVPTVPVAATLPAGSSAVVSVPPPGTTTASAAPTMPAGSAPAVTPPPVAGGTTTSTPPTVVTPAPTTPVTPGTVPAVTTPPTSAATAPAVPTSSPAVGAPGVAPAAALTPAATTPIPVPAGVLGSIRTPAELKAAIVAARAAK